LITELNISIDAAYTLARILVRSPGPFDRFTGRQILLQASQLGSAKATLHIVKSAAKSNQLDKNEVQPALAHLRKLVARDPPLIPVLVAQAKILEEEQDFKAAEQLYKRAIEHVAPAERSLASRVARRLRDQYGASEDEAKIELKITVDDKDPEQDVVAAYLGLARIQCHQLDDNKAAVVNWEVAAFEYDDPLAYFALATDLENKARSDHADQMNGSGPLDHQWIRYVPYKWYEYTMKAAVSGHAIACYNIGLFYLLETMHIADRILDNKLRRTLKESPMVNATPRTLFKASLHDAESNQVDSIRRWFLCAGRAGHNPGYLLAEFVERMASIAPLSAKMKSSLLEEIAADGRTDDKNFKNVQWTSNDQEMAQRLLNWVETEA
jgi:tetratricopeptide (TPR) repeat protein